MVCNIEKERWVVWKRSGGTGVTERRHRGMDKVMGWIRTEGVRSHQAS
jgi:hypothetical protein